MRFDTIRGINWVETSLGIGLKPSKQRTQRSFQTLIFSPFPTIKQAHLTITFFPISMGLQIGEEFFGGLLDNQSLCTLYLLLNILMQILSLLDATIQDNLAIRAKLNICSFGTPTLHYFLGDTTCPKISKQGTYHFSPLDSTKTSC